MCYVIKGGIQIDYESFILTSLRDYLNIFVRYFIRCKTMYFQRLEFFVKYMKMKACIIKIFCFFYLEILCFDCWYFWR